MSQSSDQNFLAGSQKLFLIIAAFVLSAFLLLFKGGFNSSTPLDLLARRSLEPDIALVNGRPTVYEFYADWCEACKEMAPSMLSLDEKYVNQVDIVLLNVDNSRWKELIDNYNINGIPKLIFFDEKGKFYAELVGVRNQNELEEIFESFIKNKPFRDERKLTGNDLEKLQSSLMNDKNYHSKAIAPRSH